MIGNQTTSSPIWGEIIDDVRRHGTPAAIDLINEKREKAEAAGKEDEVRVYDMALRTIRMSFN